MRVRVRLFAILRERAGASELELELPDGAVVGDALDAVAHLAGDVPVVMAVNRSYADRTAPLHPGDELALVPPVSGGASPHVRVGLEAISLPDLVERVKDPRAGAVVTFQGLTRDVERLEYEAYTEMAVERIEAIAAAAIEAHALCAAAVEHRIGTVELTQASVAVAASAPHREQAFAGAREIIDAIKEQAPIWKREVAGGRAEWVSGKPPSS